VEEREVAALEADPGEVRFEAQNGGTMMRRLLVLVYLSIAVLLVSTKSTAQYPEDALRFGGYGTGVGARSLGMANAYTGIASDFAALYWNPAGLAQIRRSEFSFGVSHLNYQNTGTFLGSSQSYSNNATQLNTFGLVYPVEVQRGNLVFALGYSRHNSFTTGLSFSGFNNGSSIVQAWAPDGQPYPPDITIAEELGLASADTNTGRFVSPINGMINQDGTVIEGGGIDNWSVGGAVDIARDLSAGVTLTFLSGRYDYDRKYQEVDVQNVYTSFPFDFDYLALDEFIRSDITGFGATLGIMYRLPERFRLGLTVRTPVSLRIKEEFGQTANSYFDNGDVLPADGPYETLGFGEYDVITPWAFGAGFSYIVGNLVLAGDAQATDWTQLEFDNANADLLALNTDIKELFRATLNWRAGAEYELPGSGVRVRGGFAYNTSPYERDQTSDFDQKYVTAGVGFSLAGYAMLDLAYAHGWWKTDRVNYDNSSQVNEDVSTNNFIATFSYRF
jgi:long-subunit fatty acid transport protein